MKDEIELRSRRDRADEINTSDFLEFITSEIQDIRQERTRQGWTTWALAAAIGTISWLILGILESQSLLHATTAKWFLGFLFAVYGLYVMFPSIDSTFRTDGRHPRFYLTKDSWSNSRSLSLFKIFVSVLVMLLLFQTSDAISAVVLVAACIITTITLLGGVLILVLSAIAYPLPVSGSWRTNLVISVAIGAGSLWVSYEYITNLLSIGITAALFEELKLAALFVVLLCLLDMLLRLRREPPLLRSLQEIRRGLFHDKFDLASAIRQSNLSIMGLRVGDIMQGDVDLFLSLSRRFNELMDESVEKLDVVKSIMKSSEAAEEEASSDQNEIIDSLMESILSKSQASSDVLDQISSVIHSIHRKTRWLIAGKSEANDELNEIMDIIEQERKRNREFNNRFAAALDDLGSRLRSPSET